MEKTDINVTQRHLSIRKKFFFHLRISNNSNHKKKQVRIWWKKIMGNVQTTTQVLFLGLDGAGKTTIINVCSNEFKPPSDLDQIKPTTGHSVTHFHSKENKSLQFGAWDLPGRDQFSKYIVENMNNQLGSIVSTIHNSSGSSGSINSSNI